MKFRVEERRQKSRGVRRGAKERKEGLTRAERKGDEKRNKERT